jgi:hypothetical protein
MCAVSDLTSRFRALERIFSGSRYHLSLTLSDGVAYLFLVENPNHPPNVWITSDGAHSARDHLGNQPASIPDRPYAIEYAGVKYNREVAYKWRGGNSVETRLIIPFWMLWLPYGIVVFGALRFWHYARLREKMQVHGFQVEDRKTGQV